MPSKTIVLFSDGTGNSAGKLFRTNVWRTYQAVDLKDPQHPPLPRQFAFYDDGVGTSSFRPLAILGGAIGIGLARNVRDIYAFLCRIYEPGDAIYAFGFSRGAFTIRIAIGLILDQGLVRYDGKEDALERNAAAAYRRFRKLNFKQTGGLVGPLRALRDRIIDQWERVRGRRTYDEIRADNRHVLAIDFVGLWDTVEAYGLPAEELTRAVDWAFWPLSMPDYDLSPKVRRAMHALSLDDERQAFFPKLWNEAPGDVVRAGAQEPPEKPGDGWGDSSRISQVWFAGVHSNVGGGYPDDGLSYVPLLWILKGAERAGLRLIQPIVAEYRALSDENGVIYDSRRGLAGYYRYNPRRTSIVTARNGVTLQSVKVHESVFRRIRVGEDGYAPIVLPPEFEVVKIDGEIVDGPAYLGIPGQQVLPVETEHVWNWVWRRRVAYFLTLLFSLTLATMPLWASTSPGGACSSELCFLANPIRWAGTVMPSFATTWTEVFAANPGLSASLSLAIVAGLAVGSRLSIQIGDRMRGAWYGLPSLRPRHVPAPSAHQHSKLDAAIEAMRRSSWYHTLHRATTRVALPVLFVAAVLYGGIAVLAQLGLAVAESVGGVCYDGEPGRASAMIRPSSPCNALPARLEEGGVYRLRLTIAEPWPWSDGPKPLGRAARIPADPNGLMPNAEPWYLPAGVPLRRHIRQPWFRLMGRIGAKGTDAYRLEWRRVDGPSTASSQGATPGQVWEAVVNARSSGRLFLYVNDAALYPLFSPFYPSNKGLAQIEVIPAAGSD